MSPVIVDNAIYVDGRRTARPTTLQEAYRTCREQQGMAWIGLYKPTEAEFASVAGEFELHELAVEDAIRAHQRPKLDRYGETLFVVLKAARYVDRTEAVEFGEIHIFAGDDFVVTVRHAESPNLAPVRQRLEHDPELLARGPHAVLYALLDRVVDDYGPVVAGLENDIDEIENEVFSGNADVSRRAYELTREVIEFQRAVKPLPGLLGNLIAGFERSGDDPELRQYLRDVQDHALQVQEQVASFRALLQNILSVNLAIVGVRQNDEVRAMSEAALRQNDEVKKISAWAAILFAPTLIGTIYGMNFVHMPELDWIIGYPLALGMMVAVSLGLYSVFKRRGWLS
ncbi:MAG TPA: magnesium and cobalt transport protein CorA [Thermomicrobiales bacterium]|nr:magnesium and cobalt transport protein CorA [Thermomicrobiales bacterium]